MADGFAWSPSPFPYKTPCVAKVTRKTYMFLIQMALGCPCCFIGCSWVHYWFLGEVFGVLWGHFGVSLGCLGVILGSHWGPLGSFCGPLGFARCQFGGSWGQLGSVWMLTGSLWISWKILGGHFGAPRVHFGVSLGCPGLALGSHQNHL